jgi:hypothetical protein
MSDTLRKEFELDGEKWGKVNRETAYQEWLEQRLLEDRSSLTAAREEAGRLREFVRDIEIMLQNVRIDFSNGVNFNGIDEGAVQGIKYLKRLHERINELLNNVSPAPAKTCRWKRRFDGDIWWVDTGCSKTFDDEIEVMFNEDLSKMHCPGCGKSIEEVKGKGDE